MRLIGLGSAIVGALGLAASINAEEAGSSTYKYEVCPLGPRFPHYERLSGWTPVARHALCESHQVHYLPVTDCER
jgi:hypothetical protein